MAFARGAGRLCLTNGFPEWRPESQGRKENDKRRAHRTLPRHGEGSPTLKAWAYLAVVVLKRPQEAQPHGEEPQPDQAHADITGIGRNQSIICR